MYILYNFKKYDIPKRGVFSITTDEYVNGWVCREEENLIIGETDDTFVTRLLKTGHGEWVGDVVIQTKYILPVGIHKSRLIKWLAGVQLTLFDY